MPPPAYLDAALRVNERYAAQFGITLRLITRCVHTETLPPFWARVALVADAHRLASVADARGFVIGLDGDAAFASMSYDLRQELVEVLASKAVAVVREAPFRESGTSLSSGFFGVRLGTAGQSFLEDWLAGFDADQWRQWAGRWEANSEWAGDTYEQGQLQRVVARHRALVQELPQCLLNSAFPRPLTEASMHNPQALFFLCWVSVGGPKNDWSHTSRILGPSFANCCRRTYSNINVS